MKLRQFYVYIMTNRHNRVLYIGVTGDLVSRVDQHKQGLLKGFTQDYNLHKLIFFEVWDTADRAIAREKQLKNWHRQWKINLIRQINPNFKDLSDNF